MLCYGYSKSVRITRSYTFTDSAVAAKLIIWILILIMFLRLYIFYILDTEVPSDVAKGVGGGRGDTVMVMKKENLVLRHSSIQSD